MTDDRIQALQRYVGARSENLKTILPPNMNVERMRLVAMSAVSRNPKLLEASPESFMLQLYVAAELGLEAGGVLNHFYLIPRGGQVTGMVGFKGYIEIALREKLAKSIRAECIYQGEEFHYDRGTQEIHHPYSLSVKKDEKAIIGAYAIAELHNGGRAISVLDRDDLDKRKAKAVTKNVWNDWPKEMCMKSAIRDLFNRGKVSIPAHGQFSQAMQAGNDFDEGKTPQPERAVQVQEVEPATPKLTGSAGLKDKIGKRKKGTNPRRYSERVDDLTAYMDENHVDAEHCLEPARAALGIAEGFDFTVEDFNSMSAEQRAKVAKQMAEECKA